MLFRYRPSCSHHVAILWQSASTSPTKKPGAGSGAVVSGQAKIAGDAQAPSSKSGRDLQMSAHITTHFRRFRLLELLLSAVALCAAGTNAVAAPVYTFTDLGPMGGTVSYGSGINNSGKVIGSIYVAGDQHATLWNGTTATDLGTLGGTSSFGVGINNSGQVVGWSYTTTVGEGYHATAWNGTVVTDLGTLGGTYSLAYGINNSGQVVGFGHTVGDAAAHATLWNGTVVTDLGTLGGTSSYAFGISDSGQVVGKAYTAAGDQHATLWNGTTATDLGTLGGKISAAYAINNSGQIVGDAYTAAGDQHATLWNGTTATDLGTLGGRISYAFGINNSGQVVGSSFIPGNVVTHATLWNGAAGTDLNSFLDAATVNSGWVLTEGHGINDGGWITGVARNSITGQEHAYLLSAVPEPETCALMLAGLGVLGLTVRYRKGAAA